MSPSEKSSTVVEIDAGRAAKRVLEIDALRGLAAVGVMIWHYRHQFTVLNVNRFLDAYPYGSYCVLLFFAISGFVILMTAERSRSVVDFAVARFSRLYPAYWVAVIVSFFLIQYSGGLALHRSNSRLHAIVNLTMIQEVFGIPDIEGSFWTLYVELTFYLMVGGLMAVRTLNSLPWCLAGLAIFKAANSVLQPDWLSAAVWATAHYFAAMRYAEYFCLGVCCYKLTAGRDRRFLAMLACLVGCAAVHGQMIVFLCIGSLLYAASQGYLPFLANRYLLFFGTISYSLYLLHLNVGNVVMGLLQKHGISSNAAFVAAIAVTVAAASATCFLVERPVHDAIRKWWRLRRPTTAAAAAV